MGDLEFFNPSEGGESYDPAAFERFKEKAKKNAKFIAAIKKQEQKQKKKEDELFKILMKFFQTHTKPGILLLAARLLEQNVPPSFVLAVLLLGNEELKKEAGNFLGLPEPEKKEGSAAGGSPSEAPPKSTPEVHSEFSLIANFSDKTIPLKVKAEIDIWGKTLLEAATANPFRLIETILEKNGKIKPITIDCMANVMQDYLEHAGVEDFAYESMYSFCEFLARGILQKIRYDIENRKLLPEEF